MPRIDQIVLDALPGERIDVVASDYASVIRIEIKGELRLWIDLDQARHLHDELGNILRPHAVPTSPAAAMPS